MKNFDSLSLYNDWTEEPTENAGRKYVFRNDTGTGSTTVYSVFPGIELLYNEIHMAYDQIKKIVNFL